MSDPFTGLRFLLEPILVGGILVPFVFSAVIFALAWCAARWRGQEVGGWPGALALGGGFLAGAPAVLGRPPVAPAESTDWLFYLTAAATVFGLGDGLSSWPSWGRWVLRLYFVATAFGLLLRPALINNHWETWDSLALTAGLCLAGLAWWANLDALSRRLPGAAVPLTLMGVVAGSAAVLALTASARWAQLEAVFLAALAGGLGPAFVRPAPPFARGGSAVATMLLPGMWLVGYCYGDTPLVCILLLSLGAGAAWLGRLRWVARLPLGLGVPLRALAVLGPVVLAVARAYRDWPGVEDL
jgi:hypothetical protein